MGEVNGFPERYSVLRWRVSVLFHMSLDSCNFPRITG